MDQAIRNKLRNVVTQCRKLLEEAVTQVLQGQFGISASGKKDEVHVEDESSLKLSAEDQGCRQDLVAHMGHIQALGYKAKDALAQLVREIAFTHLNRLCAYKMMEAREVWVGGQRFREAVSRGIKSQGFQFYLADHPEYQRPGNNDDDHAHWQEIAYRHFLGWLGALLSEEIGVLFSPTDPANRLFPPQRVLDEVLALLNSEELKDIWVEDETIGWVYQYFTPKELRDQVRKESATPRNSYELAFRNQFFTPRYVVEFLTDNTLGRIWYEMRQGNSSLKDRCRYMVRRPDEVFLSAMATEGHEHYAEGCGAIAKLLQAGDEASFPAFTADGDDGVQPMIDLAHCVNAYERNGMETFRWWQEPEARVPHEPVESFTTQELLDYLFMTCRADRHGGDGSVYRERWFVDVANEVRRRAISYHAENATQEQLLKAPKLVPLRAKKDPRDIKILDPACGSGHFLLYCFDLLQTIYEEAYEDEELGPKLKEDYPTLKALRRHVPRLILAHNLHGIDIDLRATQIAALALWLRCQRAYREIGVKQDRPKINRSNIVCAESMPGEKEMLTEFVADLQPRLLGHLVEVVFDKMRLAGEAGSLLKIEEELRDAIADARKRWGAEVERATDRKGRLLLFSQAEMERAAKKTPQPQLFDFSEITDEQFWNEAESRVLSALRAYTAHAANGGELTKQLFVEDAERGFAFIDLCQKRFDVLLMNPPFGESSKNSKDYIAKVYPRTKHDLYTSFVERGLYMLVADGFLGAITSRTGFFLSTFQRWREEVILGIAAPTVFADLGYGVLDTAMVETASFCLGKGNRSCGAYIRLLSKPDKQTGLVDAVLCLARSSANGVFHMVRPSSFALVPGSPFAYWLTEHLRRRFRDLPPFESEGRELRIGDHPGDGFRWLRLHNEVPLSSQERSWLPYHKGGTNSPFFDDVPLVVDWDQDRQTYRDFHGRKGRPNERPSNYQCFLKPGITFPYLPHKRGHFAHVPPGGIFGHASPILQLPREQHWAICALLNSDAYIGLLHSLMPRGGAGGGQTLKYEVGYVRSVPIPLLDAISCERLAALALEAYGVRFQMEMFNEVRRLFVLPNLCEVPCATLSEGMAAWQTRERQRLERLQAIQRDINNVAFALYGIEGSDRLLLEGSLQGDSNEEPSETTESDNSDDEEQRPNGGDPKAHVSKLVSYCIGVAFGRWDVRLACGQKQIPTMPDPFTPLPVSIPGMLRGNDGLPLKQAPRDYPIRIDSDGLVPDDPDHSDDIVCRVREVLELLWKDRAEAIEKEACQILGVKELRDYFRKPGKGGFWDDHVSRYSKSRRKAPMYWLLQSSKRNYGLWLYYHRLDKDILFKARQNYVEPKIRLEQTRLDSLRSQKTTLGADAKGAKKIDKDIERQEALLGELKDFVEKLERAAKLNFGNSEKLNSEVVYDPDLNDGVVLTIAPLWELVPWKEAKNYWEELIEGKYEWSSMGKLLGRKGLV